MEPPKCRICGKSEWRHVCEDAALEVRDVVRRTGRRDGGTRHAGLIDAKLKSSADVAEHPVIGFDSQARPPKQRWKRDAYNEYQKEYMKGWRARRKKKAIAL